MKNYVTILCDCESKINCRPLTNVSEDPGELISLTHLQLFLGESNSYSVSDIEEVDSQKLSKRIKYRRKLFNDLRQRFRKEYLSELIQESNENSSREPKVREIVLIGDDNKKRLFWPMARTIEQIPGETSVISRLWQRFQDDGNVSRCYSTGRPRVTTPNEDRYLADTAKRNSRSTASDLSRQLSSATVTTVSRQTVYRCLRHIGLYFRRPIRCVPLTATHCRLRLTWSREHALWTPQQWSCVMFSDESRFSLQSDSRRILIWRASGTRYHQDNTIKRHRYGGAGWLVWGGIILGSRTDLHVQSVTMTGHIFWDVILEQHVRFGFGAPWVLNFCLWMTTPILTMQTL
ncbi:HTH_Tnp_Tc3_2 domain-containing protein [Trichonephila clavipes]|nr:HTH_Tnp_Tc3_2 domain-containing protein [Trichonephila clavipes]